MPHILDDQSDRYLDAFQVYPERDFGNSGLFEQGDDRRRGFKAEARRIIDDFYARTMSSGDWERADRTLEEPQDRNYLPQRGRRTYR